MTDWANYPQLLLGVIGPLTLNDCWESLAQLLLTVIGLVTLNESLGQWPSTTVGPTMLNDG